jgi:hypothetical protein
MSGMTHLTELNRAEQMSRSFEVAATIRVTNCSLSKRMTNRQYTLELTFALWSVERLKLRKMLAG